MSKLFYEDGEPAETPAEMERREKIAAAALSLCMERRSKVNIIPEGPGEIERAVKRAWDHSRAPRCAYP